MPWPTPQDYNEAIQAPTVCFADQELKAGKPEHGPTGMPRPISGSFASVYRMNCGSRVWAVRCFTREVDDQQKRYDAISSYLRAVKLPCFVEFEFIKQGILVNGQWYPILKMEWIDGETLDKYLEKNRRHSAKLQVLACQWIDTLRVMRQARIAHGDLQHGNILVSANGLKLIDYDGMFVPALDGMSSHEEGHPNYQHPSRRGRDFGSYVDAFSGWVIYTAILAIQEDPEIWTQLNAGDECLLLRRGDFADPGNSRAFKLMAGIPSPSIRHLVDELRSHAKIQLPLVPSVDHFTSEPSTSSRSTQSLPDWIVLPSKAAANEKTSNTGISQASLGASWLSDHIPQSNPLVWDWEDINVTNERVALSVVILLILALAAATILGVIPWWLATLNCVALVGFQAWLLNSRYAGLQINAHLIRTIEAIDESRHRLSEIEKEINRLNQSRLRSHQEIDGSEAALNGRLDRYQKKISSIGMETKSNCMREQVLDDEKWKEIERDKERERSEINRINEKLRTLEEEKNAKIAKTLNDLQKEYVRQHLLRVLIQNARLPFIHEREKQELEKSQFRTAQDVLDHKPESLLKVRWIGKKRQKMIRVWAEEKRREAEAKAPKCLPNSELERIATEFATMRKELEADVVAINRRHLADRERLAERFSDERNELLERIKSLQEQRTWEEQNFAKDKAQLETSLFETSKRVKNDIEEFDKQVENLRQIQSEKCSTLDRLQKSERILRSRSFTRFVSFVFFNR
jgi:serine/threonine protein kinase